MDSRKSLAIAIINFLKAELESGRLGEEGTEALEVGIQCLETAYSVEDGTTCHVDLLNLYQSAVPPSQSPVPPSQQNASALDKEKAEMKKVEGNDFMRDGKFHDAIASYTEAINFDPHNAIYFSNRAAAYAKLNDNKNSIVDCEKALQLDPSYSKAYGRMGLAYFNDENYEKAVEAYEHALTLDPANQPYKVQLDSAKEKLIAKTQGNASNPSGGAGGPNNPLAGMDLSSLLSNPAVMNMAQSFMSSPQVQNMFSNMMSGGGGGGGGGGSTDPASSNSGGAQPQQNPPAGTAPAPPGGLGGLDFNSVLNATSQFASQLQQQNPEVVDTLRSQFQGTMRPPDSKEPESK